MASAQRGLRGRRAAWLLILGSACDNAPPAPAPPPPEVRVIVADAQKSANVIEVPGRLQAVRTAEVRAQVDGIVKRRMYDEGTDVKAGDVLFQIDPRELQAQLSATRAALTRAEATAANAAQEAARYGEMVVQQVISRQEHETAVARSRTAQADVAQARAQVEAAQLKLSHATVTAPIAGRAGRAEVTEGALVSGASATRLTRIEQVDPIYMNFSQSSSDILAVRREIASGALKVPELGRVTVHLVLEDGSHYPLPGVLNFFDLRIDEATGTSAFRAEFPNPKRALLPGQFVRARVEAGVRSGVFLVPQRAVVVAPQGAHLLVVAAGDVVEQRAVTLGNMTGSSWTVLSGLNPKDRVIVDGLQKAQPGRPVRVLPGEPSSAGSAGASTTAEPPAAPSGSPLPASSAGAAPPGAASAR
jgi:membrane fusion protein, multidrug efflux system